MTENFYITSFTSGENKQTLHSSLIAGVHFKRISTSAMTFINDLPLINKHCFEKVLQPCAYTFIGLVLILILFFYVILVSPIFLYRLIVTTYIAPKFRPGTGEAVLVNSQYLTTEFIPSSFSKSSDNTMLPPTRCPVVVCMTFPGTIKLQDMAEVIRKGWLTTKEGETKLKYPEFQQYPEMWMGFMFWTQDTMFSLENHVFAHKLPDKESREDSEKYLCDLVEKLVNKQFIPKRSPWEVHLLQNYRQPSEVDGEKTQQHEYFGNDDEDTNTVIIFRFHHGMADGFSALNAFIEGLLGISVFDIDVAKPRNIRSIRDDKSMMMISQVKKWTYTFWRTLYDLGYFVSLRMSSTKYARIPWYVPDKKKKWKQLYVKSKLIPVNKIKFVKNKLGASFTGVLLSCVEAGTAKNMRRKGFTDLKCVPFFSAVPLPGHPGTLQNHATGTLFNLDVTQSLNSVERLQRVEQRFIEARYFSQMPFLMGILRTLFSFPLAPLTKSVTENKVAPAGLSNFPGPGVEMQFLGKSMKTVDFCVGGLPGVAGVVFALFSYNGHVRLTVTAENGIMEREELKMLIRDIETEVEELYKRAKDIEEMVN